MFSCSNDTTIKIWNLSKCFDDSGKENAPAKSIKSLATLNEENDYIRAFAFSELRSTLYSIADNGIVKTWDVDVALEKSSS